MFTATLETSFLRILDFILWLLPIDPYYFQDFLIIFFVPIFNMELSWSVNKKAIKSILCGSHL